VAVRAERDEGSLVETLCSRVRERMDDGQAEHVEEFVRQYYRWVPPEDLAGRTEVDLYGAGAPASRSSASTTRRSSSTAGSRRTR
jgi:hypothetical protein